MKRGEVRSCHILSTISLLSYRKLLAWTAVQKSNGENGTFSLVMSQLSIVFRYSGVTSE